MARDEKLMIDFVRLAIETTISSVKTNRKEDPSFSAIRETVAAWGITDESAWSLYRPVFWYLTEQRIVVVGSPGWSLNPEYQSATQDMLNELVKGVLRYYRDTLNARLEKVL